MYKIYRISFIIIALFLFQVHAWSKNSFDILIKIDSSINAKNIRIEYFDGKKNNFVSDTFANHILRLRGIYYSEYVTLTISIAHGTYLNGMSTFFVNNHPAKICLSQYNNGQEILLGYDSLIHILPALDTGYNELFKELSEYREKEVAAMNYFWIQNPRGPSNDSLHHIFKKVIQALNDKTISFLQKHSNDYYSFWFFKNQIIDFTLTFCNKDTAYLSSLLIDFKSIFPRKYVNSFEGVQLNNHLESYIIPPPDEKQIAPSFAAKDVNGNDIVLNSLKGKYVLLDFWATWCAPCMTAIPLVKKLRADFSPDSLVIIAINKDRDLDLFKKEIERSKMNWMHIFDDENKISGLYGVHAIPVSILINKDGVIIYRCLGLGKDDEKQIDGLLRK